MTFITRDDNRFSIWNFNLKWVGIGTYVLIICFLGSFYTKNGENMCFLKNSLIFDKRKSAKFLCFLTNERISLSSHLSNLPLFKWNLIDMLFLLFAYTFFFQLLSQILFIWFTIKKNCCFIKLLDLLRNRRCRRDTEKKVLLLFIYTYIHTHTYVQMITLVPRAYYHK